MYHLNTTRVLYQTSKYAPVAVLQLEITVPPEIVSRKQIHTGLDQLGTSSFNHLLAPGGDASAVDIYCNLVLGLQRCVGQSAQYCRVQETGEQLEYRVFIEYEEEAVALYAAEVATLLLNGILEHQDGAESKQLLEEFEAYSLPRILDSNTRVLIRAAGRQDIPVLRPLLPTALDASAAEVQNSLLQLGWGVHQQQCNGAVSEGLDSWQTMPQVLDRALLYPKLKDASLPLPVQDLEFLNRNRVRRAQRSARRIGYPVILRPRAIRLFHYRFVEDYIFAPLHNDDELALAAKHLVENYGLDVWIESFVPGDQYRFLVMNAAVLSVVRCRPPMITGDGVQSIAELTEHMNDRDVLFRMLLSGFTMDSVLEAGIQLALRGRGSPINGGSCEDVTMEIPARFKELAIEVAEQSGLRTLADIELTIDQLSGHSTLPNCAISNVVLDPDLHMFEQLSDEPVRIGDEYLAGLFPGGVPARIPIVSITGTNGKTTTSRMVARILREAGLKTGLACTDGVYVDNELLRAGDSSGLSGAVDLLLATDVEAAVLETARGGLAHTGIAFDHCDVGACLNVASEHLGQEGIETMDEMAVHKRQVIERTTGTAVLNAEDPRCLAMREHTAAGEVILIASDSCHPAIKMHCEAGGKAIAVDDGLDTPTVVLLSAADEITPVIAVRDIPASMNGAARYNVMNAMFAIAIGMGLGIAKGSINSALKAFRMNVDNTPGRLNEVTGFPFRVIIDVAHNAHGLNALIGLIDQLPVQGRKIINFGASGEMSNESIQAFAKQAAGHFDLYETRNYFIDKDLIMKFRPFEEVPEMLKKELLRLGVPEDKITVEPDVMDSLDRSLKTAQKGDLLLVLVRVAADDKFKVIKKLQEAAI